VGTPVTVFDGTLTRHDFFRVALVPPVRAAFGTSPGVSGRARTAA
jgi:hypothetical protein